MIFRFALKNILSKPWRAVAIVAIITIAVALLFSILSFKDAVYDYIFQVETADAGDSDIVIKSNSVSDRIFDVSALDGLDGAEEIIPSLSVYALFDDEYVKVRGFEKGNQELLQDVDVLYGNKDDLFARADNVAISADTAKHFNLSVGDEMSLSLGGKIKSFYVAVIAKNTGYFLNDSPYCVIGTVKSGVARLIDDGAGNPVYNEVYIKVASDADVEKVKADIYSIPAFSLTSVDLSKDDGYIVTQTNSMTAPVVIAGLGVLLFAVACIMLVFMLGVQDKRAYLAKMNVAGATKSQVAAIFAVEALVLSFIGAVIGAVVAGGMFMLVLQLTLSSVVTFSFSALKLFIATLIGVVVALVASSVPVALAFRTSIRENEISSNKKSVAKIAFPIALLLTTVVSIIIEGTLNGAKGALSIVNVVLVVLSIAVCIPFVLRFVGKLLEKVKTPTVRIAAYSVSREKRPSRSIQTLTVGMTVAMLLFMAWTLTTEIFSGYLVDFENMVMVTNVKANVDTPDADGILNVDGVKSATPMVWTKGDVIVKGNEKTVNILGSEKSLDILDFEYITARTDIENGLSNGGIVIDYAYSQLYGAKVGDNVTLSLGNQSADVSVVGITRHNLFSGNYLIISKQTLMDKFGMGVDTVLVVADYDATVVAERIRSDYSAKNYYTVEALTAYEWDASSMNAIFDLVGVLAIVLFAFVFVINLAYGAVSHSYSGRMRANLLSAGMSKNSLLGAEIIEYAITALVAFIISFASSVLITYSLVNALRLFGLYFEFMYETWIVAVVGIALSLGYALLPLILGFKRSYNMRRL